MPLREKIANFVGNLLDLDASRKCKIGKQEFQQGDGMPI